MIKLLTRRQKVLGIFILLYTLFAFGVLVDFLVAGVNVHLVLAAACSVVIGLISTMSYIRSHRSERNGSS